MQQLTVPTPYAVGEVHIYTTEVDGELVLFDTGPPTAAALAFLKENVELDRLRHVFITHCHVDHYGLADYLSKHSRAEIYLPHKDAVKIKHHHKRLEGIEGLLRVMGFDAHYVERFRQTVISAGVFPNFPQRYHVVEETDALERLGFSFLNCPGHSQSDLVYLGDDWAITGDTLLRGIFQAPLLDLDLDTLSRRFDNYGAYCTSLRRMIKLRGLRLLPGHRRDVDSLDAAILFYVGKLMERAKRVKKYAHEDDVSVIVRQLFGPAMDDPFHVYLKASEIVFMQDFLVRPQQLREALDHLGLFDRIAEDFTALTAQ
ncbi:MAG: MBL fold metallo-hydrolase [Desulfuromonadales bacterium]